MSYQLPFLPLEIQTSIAELRALGVPESALDLLIDRTAKAIEAKTTSLQRTIVEIERSIDARLDQIGARLQSDIQSQHGDTNGMLADVRQAQQRAHPQIASLAKAVEDIGIWGSRLEAAFVAGRDFAASERARLEAAIGQLDQRLTIVEQALEIEPKADS